jgi:hypothetical protein
LDTDVQYESPQFTQELKSDFVKPTIAVIATYLVLSWCAWAQQPASSAAQAEQIVSITLSRPISRVVEEVARKCGVLLSYEDPIYEAPSDIEDVAAQVRRNYPLDRTPVWVPARRSFSFHVPDCKGGPSGFNAEAAIEPILSDYARQYGVSFGFRRAGSRLAIVPLKGRDHSGDLVEQTPVLDTVISVPEAETNGMAALEAILEDTSRQSGIKLEIGTVPLTLIRDPVTFGATNIPARVALARLLDMIPETKDFSWLSYFGPGENTFAVNLVPLTRTKPLRP